SAPDTIALQPAIVAAATRNFTGTVLGRLDAVREQSNLPALRSSVKDDPIGPAYQPESRFTIYATGTFAGGNRSGSLDLNGFDYIGGSGTSGIEYRVGRGLIVGLAGNYTSTNAHLDKGGSIDVDALQVAAYSSYSSRHLFADALIGYGHHDVDLARA